MTTSIEIRTSRIGRSALTLFSLKGPLNQQTPSKPAGAAESDYISATFADRPPRTGVEGAGHRTQPDPRRPPAPPVGFQFTACARGKTAMAEWPDPINPVAGLSNTRYNRLATNGSARSHHLERVSVPEQTRGVAQPG